MHALPNKFIRKGHNKIKNKKVHKIVPTTKYVRIIWNNKNI